MFTKKPADSGELSSRHDSSRMPRTKEVDESSTFLI